MFACSLGKTQHGFSLIELVTVIVLLGILMVTVAPRFAGKQTFVEKAVRDQLLSSYRYAQQRAMYDNSGNCYRLLIDSHGFGPQRDDGSSIEYIGPVGLSTFTGDYAQVSAAAQIVFFDGLGNVRSGSCSGSVINNAMTITLSYNGIASISLEIFPSGYARPI